jgi:hypothetical protein
MFHAFLLEIIHKHGVDLSLYATNELAQKGLAKYCKENWGTDEMGEIPDSDNKIIARYFEIARDNTTCMDNEEYEITRMEVIETAEQID